MKTPTLAILLAFFLCGCIIKENVRPTVDLNLDALSQYNFRGQVFNEEAVAQASSAIGLETTDGGVLRFLVEGNMDLREKTGDAWFPDGHSGKFTEVEIEGGYGRRVGDFDLFGGVTSYILPNGLEFPNGERGETVELFVAASTEVRGFVPEVVVHYDIDEVEDIYATASVSRLFGLRDKLNLQVTGQVGYSSKDASLWTYGIDESGISDANARAELSYDYDANTIFRFAVAGSTIVDTGIQDWFDIIGIDQDNLWASVGVTLLY